jgi:hypothetical protein
MSDDNVGMKGPVNVGERKADPMKSRILFLAMATGAAATLLSAQEVTTKQTTVQSADGSRIVTVTGEVVRYEPGQTIVIRQPDRQEVTYAIGADAAIPPDIQVGRRVTISTEPASDMGRSGRRHPRNDASRSRARTTRSSSTRLRGSLSPRRTWRSVRRSPSARPP